MKFLIATGILVAASLVCVSLAVQAVFITLGVTEHWGAARTGNAMMTMLWGIASLFLFSLPAVYLALARVIDGVLWRLLATFGYAVVLAFTGFLIAFLSAVIFNR